MRDKPAEPVGFSCHGDSKLRIAEMVKHNLSDRSFIFAIVILLCLIYPPYILSNISNSHYIMGDCHYYRAVVLSILDDGDLLLANNISTRDPLWGQLAVGREGLVPKHPILMPLFSLPFYFLFKDKGLLLFNVIDSIILIVLIFKLNRLFFNGYVSFATAMLYATGTLLLSYTYNYSPDVFSSVLVLGGLYFVLINRFYAGAFLLGLSVFAKLPNLMVAGVILSYAALVVLTRRQPGNDMKESSFFNKGVTITTTAVIFFVALIPFAYTNHRLFGSPFVTGYQRTAVAGDEPGQILVVNHANKFNQPLLAGTYQVLFYWKDANPSAPKNPLVTGLIPTNPVIILSFLGVFLIRRSPNKGKLYLLLTICLVQLVFYAKYDESYASHFSNRFLMTFIALSSVFTGNFFNHIIDKVLSDDV